MITLALDGRTSHAILQSPRLDGLTEAGPMKRNHDCLAKTSFSLSVGAVTQDRTDGLDRSKVWISGKKVKVSE